MTWDEYYLGICNAVAKNSKCLSRQIGAILVRDKSIISTGYNGPPRGIPQCGSERLKYDKELEFAIQSNAKPVVNYYNPNFVKPLDANTTCPRQVLGYKSGQGLGWCIAIHAERSCIINAARKGIATKDCSMYMTCGVPCSKCAIEIIEAGIVEVVVTSLDPSMQYDKMSKFLFDNSSINLRLYGHLEEK